MQQITNNSVTGNSSTADQEVLVKVEGVSKKFCRSLKKSLWYGLCDIAGELSPFGRRDIAGLSVSGEGLLVDPSKSQITTNTPGYQPGGITSNASGLRDGEFYAVRDVSFELRRGECLGLIGHNGAGKTTLLKMLNGLIKPDAGKITMRGRSTEFTCEIDGRFLDCVTDAAGMSANQIRIDGWVKEDTRGIRDALHAYLRDVLSSK